MESFLSISQAMWYTNLGPVPEIFVRSCKCHPIVMFREAFRVTITVSWSKGSTISVEERSRGKCPVSKLNNNV